MALLTRFVADTRQTVEGAIDQWTAALALSCAKMPFLGFGQRR